MKNPIQTNITKAISPNEAPICPASLVDVLDVEEGDADVNVDKVETAVIEGLVVVPPVAETVSVELVLVRVAEKVTVDGRGVCCKEAEAIPPGDDVVVGRRDEEVGDAVSVAVVDVSVERVVSWEGRGGPREMMV